MLIAYATQYCETNSNRYLLLKNILFQKNLRTAVRKKQHEEPGVM